MRALITADIHLNDNLRDFHRISFLRTFRDICRTHRADIAIVLGDITDKKDNHGSWLVNQVADHFYRLAGICQNVIVLRGNHDYLSPEFPFYRFLQRIDGVSWINTPTEGQLLSTAIRKALGRTLWLPHTDNPQRDWKGLDTKAFELIFTHQTFKGATAGFGRKLEGIDPEELLPGNAVIVSGDIHVPQNLGRVRYVGAPYTVNFGDSYEPRVLLLEGNKMTSIKCTGPQKRLVEAQSLDEFKIRCDKVANTRDLIKARITVDNLGSWPAIKESIKSWCDKHGLVAHTIQPILLPSTHMKERATADTQRSDQQRLKDYGKLRNMDGPTLKTGLSLLEEQ
jgi:predicted phosphodiesterase